MFLYVAKAAARAHRCGVLWRKRSQGTCSAQCQHWGERVLSLRHPCRLRGRPALARPVDAMTYLCTGATPALSWLTPSECQPA
jgi:transposase